MHEAIRLSLEKMRAGCGGPFGAVITKDGKIIGRGWNQVTTANDPAAHAEITAIREATRPDARLTLMPFGNSARPVPEQRCYLASSNCGFLRRRFMSTTSLRMQATSATFGFLPAARSFK